MDNRHYQAFANPSTEPSLSTLASEGYASSGSASENQLPTVPGPAWYHSVSSEIHNAIKALGLDPDHLKIDQLAEGILKLKDELIPVGSVIALPYDEIPDGWLLMNHAAVSRTVYSRLFAKIGTKYGAGDGSTTFNLPDARDRFIEGAGTHAVGTYLEAGLPNITGELGRILFADNEIFGTNALKKSYIAADAQKQSASYYGCVAYAEFDASDSNSIYGKYNTVQPPSLVLNYMIKY
jgi:microcystin-dependent protein